jgi:hypothetical protein
MTREFPSNTEEKPYYYFIAWNLKLGKAHLEVGEEIALELATIEKVNEYFANQQFTFQHEIVAIKKALEVFKEKQL